MAQPAQPAYSPYYDPATQLELLRTQRNMALSQALLQQSLAQPEPNMMAGRYVVAQSPLGNAARLGAALLANRNINSGLEKQLGAQQAQFESMGQAVDAATGGQYVTGNRAQDILMMRDNPEEYQKNLASRNAFTDEYKNVLASVGGDKQLAQQIMLQGRMKSNAMTTQPGQYYVDPVTKRIIGGMPDAPIAGAQPQLQNGEFKGWDTQTPINAKAGLEGATGGVQKTQEILSRTIPITNADGSTSQTTYGAWLQSKGVQDPSAFVMQMFGGQAAPQGMPQAATPGANPEMPGLVNVPNQPMPQAGNMQSWQVSPSVQGARDNNRVVVLNNELANEQQRMQQAMQTGNKAAFALAQKNMSAIQTELHNLGKAPGITPAATQSPGMVQTSPSAADVAKNKARSTNIEAINNLYQGPGGVVANMTRNQNALQSLNHAYQILASGGNVGPGNAMADMVSRLGNELGMGAMPSAENRQAYNKYISDVLAQAGGSTDAERANLAHTLPGVDFTNRDAALKVLPTIMGRFKAQIDQGRAAQAWVAKGGDLTEFHQKWQLAYDPEVYAYQQASPGERDQIIKRIKGAGQLDAFRTKVKALHDLGASL